MRTDPVPADSQADRIILLGTGETAVATLWRLAAAGAHVRWYVDHADLGAEIVLANALGRGRLELCFGDARAAPLDGAAAIVAAGEDGLDPRIAARARAEKVPVHIVGRRELPAFTPADLSTAARPQ
jgi:siroheme synthase (precorrin-2 oxidase/ferrochelatase)